MVSNALLPTVYDLQDPVSDDQLERLAEDSRAQRVQMGHPIEDDTWRRIAGIVVARRPDLAVRVYGHYGQVCDLSFLHHLRELRRFSADRLDGEVRTLEALSELPHLESLSIGMRQLDSLDALRHVAPQLFELAIGATKTKRVPLAPLARFASLRSLHVEGITKDIDVIAALSTLHRVSLRSISASVGTLLAPLPELRDLWIGLGDKHALEPLRGHPSLRRIELWPARGLDDIGFLADVPALHELRLEALSRVDALPLMPTASALRHIVLTSMKDFTNVASFARLPHLEAFALWGIHKVAPSDLASLLESATLREVSVQLRSRRDEAQFERMRAAAGKAPYERWGRVRYADL